MEELTKIKQLFTRLINLDNTDTVSMTQLASFYASVGDFHNARVSCRPTARRHLLRQPHAFEQVDVPWIGVKRFKITLGL